MILVVHWFLLMLEVVSYLDHHSFNSLL